MGQQCSWATLSWSPQQPCVLSKCPWTPTSLLIRNGSASFKWLKYKKETMEKGQAVAWNLVKLSYCCFAEWNWVSFFCTSNVRGVKGQPCYCFKIKSNFPSVVGERPDQPSEVIFLGHALSFWPSTMRGVYTGVPPPLCTPFYSAPWWLHITFMGQMRRRDCSWRCLSKSLSFSQAFSFQNMGNPVLSKEISRLFEINYLSDASLINLFMKRFFIGKNQIVICAGNVSLYYSSTSQTRGQDPLRGRKMNLKGHIMCDSTRMKKNLCFYNERFTFFFHIFL